MKNLKLFPILKESKKKKNHWYHNKHQKPKGTKVLIKIYHEKFKFQILLVTFRYLLDICF